MSAVTLGHLLAQGRGHLDAAIGLAGTPQRSESVVTAARLVGQLTFGLSRYLDDIAPYSLDEAITRDDLERDARATVDAREAMKMAAEGLRDRDAEHDVYMVEPPDLLVAHLAAAATLLTAGRDLLRTHFSTDPDGWPQRRDWAEVITSAPVARALLAEVADWLRQVTRLTGWLSLLSAPDPAVPASVHEGLADAYRWLLTGSAAFTAGQGDLATEADTELMRAVPVSLPPRRRPPQDGETVGELAQGVATSAARLRIVALAEGAEALRSTVLTAESWRWTATGAAVICHLSELVLRSLADSPGLEVGGPGMAGQLSDAADAAAEASARWRGVAAGWNLMTTATSGLTAPGIADTGDLILRLGRLAFTDPGWTPLRARRAPMRDVADLAPNTAQAAVVVGALHNAVDILAQVGAADLRAVETVIQAWRIYMPTRALPEYYDVPYRYGKASPEATADLLRAYRAACGATDHAVTGLDTVAVTMNAPTRFLAAAKAAISPAPSIGERREAGPLARPRQRSAASTPQPSVVWPDSVEQAVRNTGSPDLILQMRARAIDKLATKLIDEAKEYSQDDAPGPLRGHGRTGPLARNPARAAGENFPLGPRAAPITRPGAGAPVRSAGVPVHPQNEGLRRQR
jgi:hypothetical protein